MWLLPTHAETISLLQALVVLPYVKVVLRAQEDWLRKRYEKSPVV